MNKFKNEHQQEKAFKISSLVMRRKKTMEPAVIQYLKTNICNEMKLFNSPKNGENITTTPTLYVMLKIFFRKTQLKIYRTCENKKLLHTHTTLY